MEVISVHFVLIEDMVVLQETNGYMVGFNPGFKRVNM